MRARWIIGVSGVLLLAACGQATSISAPPEPLRWWWLVIIGAVLIGFTAVALFDLAGGRPRGDWVDYALSRFLHAPTRSNYCYKAGC